MPNRLIDDFSMLIENDVSEQVTICFKILSRSESSKQVIVADLS
jgi:hypothetical protein